MIVVARYEPAQGLMIRTPVGAKSGAFRVATVIACTRAVAAKSTSRSERGSGFHDHLSTIQ